ncbi:MAG: DNA-3-methyladenine glycosylase I [Planctomycetaceae bacterium]|nr:DNA-3-methyladenine glycosylase I [Planctomycetaceae bacterium]
MLKKNKKNTQLSGRCDWCGDDPLYVKYHDEEWGRPEPDDDRKMFEFLILESAQASLSWITILRKRENYRKAFAGFRANKVAAFDESDVERLMGDPGIVRNRLKINAAINNARLFLEIRAKHGSFCDYLRSYLPNGEPIINHPGALADIPASTGLSDTISRDMKRLGFKFFGSTICYAHLQATGLVNDHLESCPFKYGNPFAK